MSHDKPTNNMATGRCDQSRDTETNNMAIGLCDQSRDIETNNMATGRGDQSRDIETNNMWRYLIADASRRLWSRSLATCKRTTPKQDYKM
ncbi:unnamed protein product [Cochlearia groenlandica]